MASNPGRADNSDTGAASTGAAPAAKEREPGEITPRRSPLIVEHAEQWVERDGDFVFDRTKIIIRQGDSVFMATTDKMESGLKGLDVENLERNRIPPEHFCPQFKEGLTRASVPLPEEIYVKRPRLLAWDSEHHGNIAALVLQEAEVCEILKKHPHPNLAQYHGCLVDNGRITGLCFTKYKSDLEKTLSERKDITEKEKLGYIKAIGDGIHHLHQLGLAHNDINPSNIMMDGEKPVIIDFDSTRPIGEKLGDKAGTFEWELEGAELSEPGNDLYGLNKIQEEVERTR
ncbi:kinase-like domain-containing protein [Chaetomium fimeti]|uniref:Kinase-like domain-containing protein n=1 Tax=Chaetomium fimeti TaxID=1854472 RepID=A0AAE0LQM4_9PEZI|nr:kinase-like domain-containing protein [Chaetomium fimeti]